MGGAMSDLPGGTPARRRPPEIDPASYSESEEAADTLVVPAPDPLVEGRGPPAPRRPGNIAFSVYDGVGSPPRGGRMTLRDIKMRRKGSLARGPGAEVAGADPGYIPPQAPPVHAPAGSDTASYSLKGHRDFLHHMKDRSMAYAAMHTAAARQYKHRNMWLSGSVAVFSLAITVFSNAVSRVMRGSAWAPVISDNAPLVLGFLSSVNAYFNYAGLAEQHRRAKIDHEEIINQIALAEAHDEENGDEAGFDYQPVIEEIQERFDALKAVPMDFPRWVAEKYPQYEAPWKLVPNAPKMKPRGRMGCL